MGTSHSTAAARVCYIISSTAAARHCTLWRATSSRLELTQGVTRAMLCTSAFPFLKGWLPRCDPASVVKLDLTLAKECSQCLVKRSHVG